MLSLSVSWHHFTKLFSYNLFGCSGKADFASTEVDIAILVLFVHLHRLPFAQLHILSQHISLLLRVWVSSWIFGRTENLSMWKSHWKFFWLFGCCLAYSFLSISFCAVVYVEHVIIIPLSSCLNRSFFCQCEKMYIPRKRKSKIGSSFYTSAEESVRWFYPFFSVWWFLHAVFLICWTCYENQIDWSVRIFCSYDKPFSGFVFLSVDAGSTKKIFEATKLKCGR